MMHNTEIALQLITNENLTQNLSLLAHTSSLQIAENWNIGKNDLSAGIQSGQVHFYLIWTKESEKSEPIGCISVFTSKYLTAFGSFIITSSYRGRGIGEQVFSSLQKMYPVGTSALLSTPGREKFYMRHGYKITGKFSNLILTASKKHALDLPLPDLSLRDKQELIHFDYLSTGIDRKPLLTSYIAQTNTHAYVAYDDAYKAVGYGLIRALYDGYRISIYAFTYRFFEEIFGKLIKHILTELPVGESIKITVDCPTAKEDAFVSSLGFTTTERFSLLFKNTLAASKVSLDGEPVWAILTEEGG